MTEWGKVTEEEKRRRVHTVISYYNKPASQQSAGRRAACHVGARALNVTRMRITARTQFRFAVRCSHRFARRSETDHDFVHNTNMLRRHSALQPLGPLGKQMSMRSSCTLRYDPYSRC
jgi:hypothetical protein